jgi:hypothetical protein
MILTSTQQLRWSVAEAKRMYQASIPGLETLINVSKIPSCGFQLLLWKVKTEVANEDNTAF